MAYNETYERKALILIEELNADITKAIKDGDLDNNSSTRLTFLEFAKEYAKNGLPDSFVKADLVASISIEILKLQHKRS